MINVLIIFIPCSCFRLILRHGSITTLNVSGSKLSSVSGPTLQSLVRKVRTLWVQNCRFVESQLNEMFSVIGSGGSSLDTLYISNNRLTGLRTELLRDAVTRLRCLHCDNTGRYLVMRNINMCVEREISVLSCWAWV